jgi:hypothetical protein
MSRLPDHLPDPLLWKGKKASELSREEAIQCALHFFNAHLETYATACAAERRMRFMERALRPGQIEKLDRWLAEHTDAMADAEKGDGSPLYRPWIDNTEEEQ